jgi:hypothetical protein
MYRPESSETENPRKERNRNYRESLEAIAVMCILVVSVILARRILEPHAVLHLSPEKRSLSSLRMASNAGG